ncbi:hypothetical protein TSUD_292220 [Trifolium subterraneum]|uniref:RNase H type-1 domain-containing protein n=1 Tax=Trifolium subterraneum TaxID=3900 RepID=A0A2Z6MJ39_TRISU|nr:hypothetical protein TSUD_292220 [Trifolium subterraneum]
MHCNLLKLVLFASPLGCHPPLNVDLNCWLNQTVFKGTPFEAVSLAQPALLFVQEFNDANIQSRPSQAATRVRNSSPVPSRQFSMFVDASCLSNAQIGWGIVFKDHNGAVLWSACKRDNIVVTPIIADALGLRWAIQTSISQGIQCLSFACDALEVVNCINSKCVVASIDPVIKDCTNLLENIPYAMVYHVSRKLNREAHDLASLARYVGSRTWMGNAPSILLSTTSVPAIVSHFEAGFSV